jgi:hypothetical protein
VLLWGWFIIGILITLPFGDTQTQLRYIALAGFILSLGSLLFSMMMIFPLQEEIKTRYTTAINGEKAFLIGLFYFARGFFLWLGIVILISSFPYKDIARNDLVEVSGIISRIEVYGDDDANLKIVFENNSNEYETDTFKIPEQNLQKIQNELQAGDPVVLLIERDDENVDNNPYIQIYGIRTETSNYLSLDEYNKEAWINNLFGFVLGTFFAIPGLIYLLTGRITSRPEKVLRIDQNAFKA